MLVRPRSQLWTHIAGFVLIVAAVSYMAYSMYPAFTTGSPDRTTFRYYGLVLSQGGKLYQDVFDNKPPLLQLLYGLAHKTGYYGSWYMMIGFVSLAAGFVWLAAKRRHIPFPWLLAILFAGFLYQPWLCHGGEVSRQYAACFQMICLASLCFGNTAAYFITGFSFCWTGLIVPTEATMLLPAIGYRLFQQSAHDSSGARRWLLVAGGVTGLLPSLIYLTVTHTWQACWEEAFVFNRTWYHAGGEFKQKFRNLYYFLLNLGFVWRLLLLSVALTFVAALKTAKQKETALLVLLHLFLLFQLAMWGSSRYMDAAYFYAAIPLFFTVILFSAPEAPSWLQKGKGKFILLAAIAITMVATGRPFFYRVQQTTTKAVHLLQQVPQLQLVQGQPGQMYVYGGYSIAELNVRLNVTSPSVWFALTPWLYWPERWDPNGSLMKENLRRVEATRCRFIIDGSGTLQLPHEKARQLLQQYLEANYQPQKIPYAKGDSILLWIRKPGL